VGVLVAVRLAAAAAACVGRVSSVSSAAADTWVVMFRLAEREYAVGVADVVEVLRMVAVTPLPEASACVRGVLNYRGRVIRVVDGRARLGLPPGDPGASASIVVVQIGERVVGVVVDEAVGVAVLPPDAVQPGGEVAGESLAVSAVARSGDELVLVLDSALLCADPSDLEPAEPVLHDGGAAMPAFAASGLGAVGGRARAS
jgi:purine-binding chemotaxis protein CheW